MAVSPETVRENYKRITHNIGEACARSSRPADSVTLMAVTKTVPPALVNTAIDCGVRLLGENRVQEYLEKKDDYLPQAEVQFIGRLQTNKLKFLMPQITLIQTVDSLHAAQEISRRAVTLGITQNVLLEVNIGAEDTKGGVPPSALAALLRETAALAGVSVRGLMTIPPPGTGETNFPKMQQLFLQMQEEFPALDTLSMGMSGDYEAAVAYGATIVRVGSGLFGARQYP